MNADLSNFSSKPGGYYEAIREDMLKYVPEDTITSLEFGYGFGGFSVLLKERFNTESWAVEIDNKAAQEAAKKLDKVINANTFESLKEIPDNYFYCIIFFDVLEHLADPYFLLLAVRKKLNEEGVIVTSFPNIRYYRAFIDFVIHGNWDYKDQGILDKTHLRFFTRKSILKMFDKLGFQIFMFEGIHTTHNRTFRLLNMILFNSFSDVRYKHFAAVVRSKS